MRRPFFIVAGFFLLSGSMCVTSPDPVGSPMCNSFQSFFRANIERDYGGGVAIAGSGANAHNREVVEHMRLASDESKRQMAIAASACEQLEANRISPAEYVALVRAALLSNARVAAVSSDDPPEWLEGLQSQISDLANSADRRHHEVLDGMNSAISEARSEQQTTAARARNPAEFESVVASVAENNREAGERFNSVAVDGWPNALDASETRSRLTRLETAVADLGARPPESSPIKVFFGLGQATLAAPYRLELEQAVREYQARARGLVVTARVTGYADTTGGNERNAALSAERARIVAEALRSMGVGEVQVDAHGRTDSFGADLQMNRVVAVVLSANDQ